MSLYDIPKRELFVPGIFRRFSVVLAILESSMSQGMSWDNWSVRQNHL